MNAVKRFLVRRVVCAIWLLSIARRALRRSIGEAGSLLSRPYAGLPTGIEVLDGSSGDEEDMRRVLVWLRNPVRLLVGGLMRSRSARRAWLVKMIRTLPLGSDISYLMHYWDHLGNRQSLLTRDPRRGLRPPVPRKVPGPCKSHVLAAYHGDADVTHDVKRVSASFHEEERDVCPVALDAYLRHRRGLSLKSHPVVVTDATLHEREYSLAATPLTGARQTFGSPNPICADG